MQKLNKDAVKRKLVYTWYFYPIIIGISTVVWLFGFKAFHQPTPHEKIVLFVGAEVKDQSFTKPILEAHKDQGMREIEVPNISSNSGMYASKLNIFLSNADLLILPESTLKTFTSKDEESSLFMKDYFVPFSQDIKTTYLSDECSYYTYEDKTESQFIDYGVLFHEKNQASSYDKYINFLANENYYLLVSTTSMNTGLIYSEQNAGFVNAFTTMKMLILGAL